MIKFSELDREECLQLLKEQPVGRVLMVEDGVPTAYPVNYLLWEEEVIFATSSQVKSIAAATRRTVGFQVDSIDARTHGGWSVLGAGEAYVLTASAKLDEIVQMMDEPWAPGQTDRVIAIPLRTLHGRRLNPAGLYSDRLCAYPL